MFEVMDIGGKRVELQSNAATPRIYRSIFGGDLLKDFTAIDTNALTQGDSFECLYLVEKLAYVMNVQATQAFRDYYGKLSERDFVEWLSRFEEEDFYDAEKLISIIAIWQKSVKTHVEAKNQASPQ